MCKPLWHRVHTRFFTAGRSLAGLGKKELERFPATPVKTRGPNLLSTTVELRDGGDWQPGPAKKRLLSYLLTLWANYINMEGVFMLSSLLTCAAAAQQQCSGTTKQGLQCRKKAIVSLDGYCEWHFPSSQFHAVAQQQCSGTTKQGLQCRKKAIASLDGYCELHYPSSQFHAVAQQQCSGTTKQGRQCRKTAIASLDGYCELHYPSYPLCEGTTRDNAPCGSRVKHPRFPLSKYCRDDHDPGISRSTDPLIFRDDFLRAKVGAKVVEKRQNVDDYTGRRLSKDLAGHELDHVVEIQCVRDSYDVVVKYQPRSIKDKLADCLRSTINLEENLNFTTKGINMLKYIGTAAFLDRYKSGGTEGVGPAGITSFLKEAYSEEYEEKKLGRRETLGIKREIVKSYDACVSEIEQDTDINREFCDRFHEMMIVGMRMK
jgi:hypothetical protein